MERKKLFLIASFIIILLLIGVSLFYSQKIKNIKISISGLAPKAGTSTSETTSSGSHTTSSENQTTSSTSTVPTSGTTTTKEQTATSTSKTQDSFFTLPDEPIGFTVMSSPGQTPQFLGGWFSRRVPFAKPGEEFEAKIEVQDEKGVSKVIFVIQSEDKKIEKEFQMELKEGDTKKGTWQTKVKVSEEIPTIWYSYFKAENKEGKTNTLVFNWK